jgi:hypothetical protein
MLNAAYLTEQIRSAGDPPALKLLSIDAFKDMAMPRLPDQSQFKDKSFEKLLEGKIDLSPLKDIKPASYDLPATTGLDKQMLASKENGIT